MLHPQPHPHGGEIPLIRIRELSAGYDGVPAVENVTLDIMSTDFTALLGPSGSGKTTLLRAIAGAADIYHGEILFDGVSVRRRRPRLGYVPQLETIDWDFPVTVEQTIMMGRTRNSALFPWFPSSSRRMARRIMERLGIDTLARRQIRELSGGQQQRVFLGRALVSDPQALLLDEPTAGTDIKTRDDILHLLDELNHQGVAILMTTHEINAVAAHLPWVVCMNRRVLAEGTPRQVFTPEILKLTYNADMPVTEHAGMTLVTETPHNYGQAVISRNGSREDAVRR